MRVELLNNLTELITKGTTPTSLGKNFVSQGVPFLRVQNIKNGKITIDDDILYIDKSTHQKELKRSQIKIGDLLITIAGTIGRTAIVRNLPKLGLNSNQAVALIRIDSPDVDLDYLRYFFDSESALKQIRQGKVTATIANLSLGVIKKLKIPLPPLKTQKRIASILDDAAALRDKTAQLLKEYDSLAQSIFLDMFGDPVINPKGWKRKPLNDICGVGSSRRVFVKDLVETGVPFYRGKEIGKLSTGKPIKPDLFITQEHYDSLAGATGVPKIGDLLMPSICPDGRILRVNDNEPFYFKDGRVLWIKINQTVINSFYLIFFLRELFRTNYSNIASGTTFAELKIVALKKIITLVPRIELQNEFAEKIVLIEQQKALAKQELKESEDLFNCLLQKAFKGELV